MRKPCVITRQHLIMLQKELKTDEAISRYLKFTRQYIFFLRKKFRIPSVADKNEYRNIKIIRDRLNGLSCIEISKKYNLSLPQVYKIVGRQTKPRDERNGRRIKITN